MTREEMEKLVDKAWVSNAAGPDYLWPGNPLEPRLWEALRIELQTRYCRSTGENMAVLSVQLTAEPSDLPRDPALIGIADEIRESGGHWQPCSGCYDTEDGHPTQKYDFSPALQTAIGCGCHECGGLGAVWWHMTDAEIADYAKICEEVDTEHQLTVRIARLEFVLRGLCKAYAACNGEDHPAYEEAQRVLAAAPSLKNFDRADWFWRAMDPDDSGDSPSEALNTGMVPQYTVCEVASSYRGPTRFGFIAPVIDPESDEEEFLHFATQAEAVNAASERRNLITSRDEVERCIACDEPLEAGDLVYWDNNDDGHIHAGCCGPERDAYVNADGEPLKDGEPIPQPFAWKPDISACDNNDSFPATNDDEHEVEQ